MEQHYTIGASGERITLSKVKIGLIGAGSISDMHLNSYQKNKDVEIYAICDQNGERACNKAEKYGFCKFYTDYNQLLADPAIDAVSICTWNDTHAEISIAALNAGKNVLVEKPLCRTVAEAHQIQKAVHRTGQILQIGFVRRFDSNAQFIHKFIENGELGQIYYAKATNIRRLGNPGGWFADEKISGGGPLLDIGVHVIDLCWYLMGKPKVQSISGNTYKKLGNRSNIQNLSFYRAADYDPSKNTVEDLANAIIRFENGASLILDVSYTLHAKQDETIVKLYGENGGVELEPSLVIISEKHDTILNMTPQTDHKSLDIVGAFQNQINHFIECCRAGNSPISPIEDGVEITKILCGIYESAAKGCEINLREDGRH